MQEKTLEFEKGVLKLLDQRKLPAGIEYFTAENYREVEYAITEMVVRGAPAIGAAGAFGVYLAAREFKDLPRAEFKEKVLEADKVLAAARPTAVNLTWAIKRMEGVLKDRLESGNNEDDKNDRINTTGSNKDKNKGDKQEQDNSVTGIVNCLYREAEAIAREDIEINKELARYGNKVVPEGATILTHYNAGALATVDYGTALGVIREAHYQGKNISVYADETRPRLQGARLTAFELVEEGIPATLIADSVAATLIRDDKIDLIVVGADRIAANGDTANKIGTYMLSEIAASHEVPFYVAAPTSTIDFAIGSGEEIEIEERSRAEVTHIKGNQIAPDKVDVYNPAFDVTPAGNITGIITEKGIISPPLREGITE